MSATAVDTPHAPTQERAAVRTEHLTKIYGKGEATVHALARVTLQIFAGQYSAIMGPSGSGKSTLLHCIAGLDSPSRGRDCVGEIEITALADKPLTLIRREAVAFVFQSFSLLPTLDAKDNIL